MTFWGHKIGQIDHKVTVTFGVNKEVTATYNDPMTFWGHNLGQIDHKGHRDFLGNKGGGGDL